MAERGRAGRTRGGRARGNLAAARGGAGRRVRARPALTLVVARREIARMDPRRSRRRPPVALGARRLRHRHCALFHRRSRAGPVGCRWSRRSALCAAAFLLRRQKTVSRRGHDRRDRGGFCDGDAGRPRGSRMACWRGRLYSVSLSGFVETRDIRERTDRFVLRVAQMESPRAADQAGARPAVGAQGHRARGRQLRRIEGAAAAAARAAAAGQLRFRPRHVLPGHRRLRLRHGRDQDRRSRRSRGGLSLRYAAFMQGLRDAIDARIRTTLDGDKRAIATALLTGRRDAITDAGQRCHVHLRPRPRAVDLRLSHGRGRRRGVLRGARAAGADPGA